MRLIVIVSLLGVTLGLGCSKDGDKGKDDKKVTACGAAGLACAGPGPNQKVDKAIGKAITPGVMPDGTQSEPITKEQLEHFLAGYQHALVYDNAIEELMKPIRNQQQSASRMIASGFEPVAMLAVADLNDREKKMHDALKAKCAYGKKNEKERAVGQRHIEITLDFYIDNGAGVLSCPVEMLTNELRNVKIDQPDENTILTVGYVTQNSRMLVKEQALVDELGVLERKANVRAEAEFTEVARNKSTLISLKGTTEIDDRITGPYRIEAVAGSFEAVNDSGVQYTQMKAAFVYRMKGYTVLLQLFASQTKGQPTEAKIYMNGRELKKEEAAKLRR